MACAFCHACVALAIRSVPCCLLLSSCSRCWAFPYSFVPSHCLDFYFSSVRILCVALITHISLPEFTTLTTTTLLRRVIE